MCCEPSHLGPPPEWRREQAGEVIREGRWPSVPSVAEGLAALASICHPGHQEADRPRPVSTEGGQGRALLSNFLRPGERYEDLAELDKYGPPVAEPNFRG